MTSIFESLQSATCVWFGIGNKRNVIVSMVAGTLVNIKVYIILHKTDTVHNNIYLFYLYIN